MLGKTVSIRTIRPKNAPTTERRAWVRVPNDREVSCQPMSAESDTGWLGTVQDVSPGGIALLLSRPFEPGTLLTIELSAKEKVASRPVPVRVVHATPGTKGRWIIGCTFACPLTQEELQIFLRE